MHQFHLRRIDADLTIGDLRQRGFQPLPVAVHADAQFQPAIGRQARRRLLEARHHGNTPAGIDRGAMRALLAEQREAEADARVAGGLGLAFAHGGNVDGLHRAAQRLGIVAAVEMLAGDVDEGHLVGPHQIAPADFLLADAQFAGQPVQRQFQRKAHTGARHAPERQDRRLVGRRRHGGAAEAPHLIGAGQDAGHLRRLQAGREGVDRIGAGIDDGLAIDRQQLAIGGGIAGDLIGMFAAIGIAGQMLAAVLQPADRPVQLHRQIAGADLLRQQYALVAEAAADIRRDDAHLPLIEAKAFGEAGAHHMRHLRRGMQRQHFQIAVPDRQHAAPFQRRHALPGGAVAPRDNGSGILHRRLETDIDGGFQEGVLLPMRMQQGGVGIARLRHVVDRRQLLEIDLDQLRQILGERAAFGEAGGDRLADMAHLALGQDRLHRPAKSGQAGIGAHALHADQVGNGIDVLSALGRLGDAANAGMRQRAAHERHLQHAGQLHVADIAAPPAQEAVILPPREARADAFSALVSPGLRRHRGPLSAPIQNRSIRPGAAVAVPLSLMLRRLDSPLTVRGRWHSF